MTTTEEKPVIMRIQFEFPPEARKWLGHHIGKRRATKKDFRSMITALVKTWEQDLSADYENAEEAI